VACGRSSKLSNRALFRSRLAEAALIHVDARVLALHLIGNARFTDLTRLLFAGLKAGDYRAQTSSVTVYQLLAEPYRRGEAEKARMTERLLDTIPGLAIVPVSTQVAAQAAQVKAQLGGGTERAIQVASAFLADADMFLTDRSALRRIAGMSVECLESYVT
jgi:predicted nucleic acid-binding protein